MARLFHRQDHSLTRLPFIHGSHVAPFRPGQASGNGFVLADVGIIKTAISTLLATTSDYLILGSFRKNAFGSHALFNVMRQAWRVGRRSRGASPAQDGSAGASPYHSPSVTDAFPPSSSGPQWPRRAAPFLFRVAGHPPPPIIRNNSFHHAGKNIPLLIISKETIIIKHCFVTIQAFQNGSVEVPSARRRRLRPRRSRSPRS